MGKPRRAAGPAVASMVTWGAVAGGCIVDWMWGRNICQVQTANIPESHKQHCSPWPGSCSVLELPCILLSLPYWELSPIPPHPQTTNSWCSCPFPPPAYPCVTGPVPLRWGRRGIKKSPFTALFCLAVVPSLPSTLLSWGSAPHTAPTCAVRLHISVLPAIFFIAAQFPSVRADEVRALGPSSPLCLW